MWQFIDYTSSNWAELVPLGFCPPPLSPTGNASHLWNEEPALFFWTLQDYLLLINSLHQKFCFQPCYTSWKFTFLQPNFFPLLCNSSNLIFAPALVLTWGLLRLQTVRAVGDPLNLMDSTDKASYPQSQLWMGCMFPSKAEASKSLSG